MADAVPKDHGLLIVLCGPSGVGKSTVVARLRATHPEIWQSVSLTTRKPRPGEIAGLHYLFCDDAAFDAAEAAGRALAFDAALLELEQWLDRAA